MKLRVVTPSGILVEEQVVKVVAEAQNGSFCLLPRHIDYVASLVPGILAFPQDGEELSLAVDEGVLVKCSREVHVSTWNAVQGPLGELKRTGREQFRQMGEREQKARFALEKIEASMVRQILEWEERGRV